MFIEVAASVLAGLVLLAVLTAALARRRPPERAPADAPLGRILRVRERPFPWPVLRVR